MLTRNIRTHYILIKEWTNQIKRIAITKSQYELFEEELSTKKHNEFFKIHDIDTWEIVFNGRANKVEWFEEKKDIWAWANDYWICSYWLYHKLGWFPDNCNCQERCWVWPAKFRTRLQEMWYSIDNDRDITKEMRTAYKAKYN